MNFNSVNYFVFFPIVTIIYFLIPKKVRYIWLLVASYYFYMNWNAKYALLLLTSTVITYVTGIFIEKTKDKNIKAAKWLVAISFLANIGMLVLFKYTNFLLDNFNLILSKVSDKHIDFVWNFALPVGISFFIFQALSYTMDVYRGQIKACYNPLKYALFVAFFPQLVAGPIERSKNLLNQIYAIEKESRPEFERIAKGLILMLWGFFVKMIIADRMSTVVDTVFQRYYMFGAIELIIGGLGFAIQVYCDFAGYSIIALGSAKVLGFTLMENFDTPFFSTSIKEFWSRWHISLSSWFKDYLYIPLGGNRKGKVRKWFNLLVTMFVSGAWHGAAWTYIMWGVTNGIYQIVGECTTKTRTQIEEKLKVKKDVASYKIGKILGTFFFFDVSAICFRSASVKDAVIYIYRMFTKWSLRPLFDGTVFDLGLNQMETTILVFGIVVLFLVDLLKYKKHINLDEFLFSQNLWFRWTVILTLLVMVIIFGNYGAGFDAEAFIYFRF